MLTELVLSTLLALAAAGDANPPRTLFDFEGEFDLERHVRPQDAAASLVEQEGNTALRIEFGHDQAWPGLRLLPPTQKWDLSGFDRVELDVKNAGEATVHLGLRVDNPGADGRRHCNTETVTLEPAQERKLAVFFGRSWGGVGFPVDPANVVALLVFVDRAEQDHVVVVDNVRAAGGLAVLPDWLGKRPPAPGDWVQTLSEEFEGNELNTELWNTRLVWDGPLERDLQVFSPGNITVEDGLLKIKFEKRTAHQYDDPNLPTRPYATACLTTFDKFTQRYGYFEARVKLPTARGGWPAFWMMPDRGPEGGDLWQRRSTHNSGMEIDIMEHLCQWGWGRYNCAAHWDGYDEEHKRTSLPLQEYSHTSDGFHAFGLLWEPGRLTWYCDGEEKVSWESQRVTSVPEYLKFTIQVGGSWATHDVDDAALPDYMLVDYVRVWQRSDLQE